MSNSHKGKQIFHQQHHIYRQQWYQQHHHPHQSLFAKIRCMMERDFRNWRAFYHHHRLGRMRCKALSSFRVSGNSTTSSTRSVMAALKASSWQNLSSDSSKKPLQMMMQVARFALLFCSLFRASSSYTSAVIIFMWIIPAPWVTFCIGFHFYFQLFVQLYQVPEQWTPLALLIRSRQRSCCLFQSQIISFYLLSCTACDHCVKPGFF